MKGNNEVFEKANMMLVARFKENSHQSNGYLRAMGAVEIGDRDVEQ